MTQKKLHKKSFFWSETFFLSDAALKRGDHKVDR